MKRASFLLILLSICSFSLPTIMGSSPPAGSAMTGFAGCNEEASLVLFDFLGLALTRRLHADYRGFDDHAITVGRDGVIMVRDGSPGEPWVLVPSGTTVDLNYVKVYDHPDSSIAFAVGDSGTVLRSDDWGHTWSDRSIPTTTNNLRGLDFLLYFSQSEAHVVVAGDSGLVMKSTNIGGVWTWVDLSLPTLRRLNSVGAVSAGFIIAASEDGIIERTTDGGVTWQIVFSAITADINRVFVSRFSPDFNRMWAVADSGKILTSIDYGYSWVVRSSDTKEHLRDVLFRNSNEGVVVGHGGTVRHTLNGGVTWLTDPYLDGLTDRDIVSVGLLDSVTAEAIVHAPAADASSVDTTFFLAVSSEPLTSVSGPDVTMPESFVLGQNYPNPFNPTTTIRFDIGHSSLVTIKICDLLGREIATLVEETKSPGPHEVAWDAAGQSSGVYLYRLEARDESAGTVFTSTRKMILLR